MARATPDRLGRRTCVRAPGRRHGRARDLREIRPPRRPAGRAWRGGRRQEKTTSSGMSHDTRPAPSMWDQPPIRPRRTHPRPCRRSGPPLRAVRVGRQRASPLSASMSAARSSSNRCHAELVLRKPFSDRRGPWRPPRDVRRRASSPHGPPRRPGSRRASEPRPRSRPARGRCGSASGGRAPPCPRRSHGRA